MRSCAILVCFIAIVQHLSAGQALHLASEQVVDLGSVPYTAQFARRSFSFVNKSNDSVSVRSVQPGCGCTSATLSRRTIGPGEKTVLNVELNLLEKQGSFSTMVTLMTSPPGQQQISVFLKGSVVRPLMNSVVPYSVPDSCSPCTIRFVVHNNADIPLSLRPDSSHSGIAVKRGPLTLAAKDSVAFIATFKSPRDLPDAGLIRCQVGNKAYPYHYIAWRKQSAH